MSDKTKFKLVIETAQIILAIGCFFYLMGYVEYKGSFSSYNIPLEILKIDLPTIIANGFLSFIFSYFLLPIPMFITTLVAIIGYYYLYMKTQPKQPLVSFTAFTIILTKTKLKQPLVLYAVYTILLTFAFALIVFSSAENYSKTEMNNYQAYFEGKKTDIDEPIICVISNYSNKIDTIRGFRIIMNSNYFYLYTATGIIGLPNNNIERIEYVPATSVSYTPKNK